MKRRNDIQFCACNLPTGEFTVWQAEADDEQLAKKGRQLPAAEMRPAVPKSLLAFMRRSRAIILAALGISVAVLACVYSFDRPNRAEVCTRYAELRAALSAADTNAVLALIAPTYRPSFDGGSFIRLDAFARPLGAPSKILILGGDATVWPNPNWYLCGVLPIGDTIEMTRVSGHWFFTGKVHLD